MSLHISRLRPLPRAIVQLAQPEPPFNPQIQSGKALAETNSQSTLRPEAGSLERWLDMNA